jgi:glycosyltransferase involved in cell wall biosynthesis
MNRGGAETLIMNLYRHMDRTKIQFDFLTCKPGVFDSEIEELGGKVHRIPYLTDVGHRKFIKQLNLFFTNNSTYQIIHSHLDKMSGLILKEAKKANIPIRIAHSHNTKSEGNILIRGYKWYVGKFLVQSSTQLVACSKEAANWLFGINNDKTIILKNGISFKQFRFSGSLRRQIRGELGIKNKDFVIGHVGRFNKQKNHNYLLEIFKELTIQLPNVYLILVGEGPLETILKEKVRKLDLENKVKFLGQRDDVKDLLNSFDLFLFPSLHEGLPVSLVEAQATGLPCIISNVISKEVDLGLDLVKYVDLNKKTEDWVKEVIQVRGKAKDRSYEIENNEFEIEKIAKELLIFYQNSIQSDYKKESLNKIMD